MIEFVIIDSGSPISELVKPLAKSTEMPISEGNSSDQNIVDCDGVIYFGAINNIVQEIAEKCKKYGRHCKTNPTADEDIIKWCRDNRIEIVYIAGDNEPIEDMFKPILADIIVNIIM